MELKNESSRRREKLASLSEAQLNIKLAKFNGWKLVDGKWWHDDIGDGPPMNYCKALGRKLVQLLLSYLP